MANAIMERAWRWAASRALALSGSKPYWAASLRARSRLELAGRFDAARADLAEKVGGIAVVLGAAPLTERCAAGGVRRIDAG